MTVCFAPKPIVFDLDGTLIDSAPDIHACVNTVLARHDVPLLTLEQIHRFIGGGVEMLWQNVIAFRDLPTDFKDDFMSDFMKSYQGATKLTRLYPGVIDTLELLAGRGHSLAICTNKPHAVTCAILDHFGIAPLFGCVIGGDTLPERKPHPAPLRAAFAGIGADPRHPQGFYVGDSEFDAACAVAVPVPFLIYAQGYRRSSIDDLPHLARFDDFAALPRLIEVLAAA